MVILRNQVKKAEGIAAITTVIVGLIAHLFGLITVVHNYDSIAVQPNGYGTGVTSGRWFLSLVGDLVTKLGGNYHLFTVNGILFILLLAVSSYFFIAVYAIRDKTSAALIGALFAVFPSVTSTMFFRYTTVYYGGAILLSVLAVWVLQRYKYGLLLSALCTACALGIYQAYVPITIGMFVLLLIRETVRNETDFWGVVRHGLYDCAALILGLMLYFALMNITLRLYNVTLSDYQGVGNMGKLALKDIPNLVWQAFYTFCMLPIRDYCGLADTKLLKLLYILLGGTTVLFLGYKLLVGTKRISTIILTVLLCLVFPVAVNFVVIMCPDSWIYTLMVFGFILVPCMPLVLMDEKSEINTLQTGIVPLLRKSAFVLVAFITIQYGYRANINYTSLYYANQQIVNYLNSIVVQVRMTEGFDTDKKWAFLGDIEDPLLYNYWQDEKIYGGSNPAHKLMNKYSRVWWIQNYYGYTLPTTDSQEDALLREREEVKAMPCWPNEGSVKVIDEYVVIKFQETEP